MPESNEISEVAETLTAAPAELQAPITAARPRYVSRSTAAFILKVADTEERLAALGAHPAGVHEHESGTERPLYLKSEVLAAKARLNADEIAEQLKIIEAAKARIAALGGEVAE